LLGVVSTQSRVVFPRRWLRRGWRQQFHGERVF